MSTDNFLHFTYRGTNSSTHKAFITGELGELRLNAIPQITNEFATPMFGKRSYYLGTTIENKNIEVKIVLNEVTLDEYRSFLAWMDPEESGLLVFDFNTDWGYYVKVDNIEEEEMVPTEIDQQGNQKFIILLNISFITTEGYAAYNTKNEGDLEYNLLNKTYTEPSKKIDFITHKSGNTFKLTNPYNYPLYFKILLNGAQNLEIKKSGETIYKTEILTAENYILYTEYGVLTKDNNWLELEEGSGSFYIKPKNKDIEIDFITSGVFNILKITPIFRSVV